MNRVLSFQLDIIDCRSSGLFEIYLLWLFIFCFDFIRPCHKSTFHNKRNINRFALVHLMGLELDPGLGLDRLTLGSIGGLCVTCTSIGQCSDPKHDMDHCSH